MSTRAPKFEDTIGSLEITPLAAAVVEALPDRKKVNAIQREFKKHARCPTSALFNAGQVVAFFKSRGLSVTAIQSGVKSKR